MSPETRQQIIALVLGIVFIIGFILFAQRLGNYIRSRQEHNKIASEQVTPTPIPDNAVAGNESTPTPISLSQRPGFKTASGQQPREIPKTGPEITIITSMIGLLGTGIYLQRK